MCLVLEVSGLDHEINYIYNYCQQNKPRRFAKMEMSENTLTSHAYWPNVT